MKPVAFAAYLLLSVLCTSALFGINTAHAVTGSDWRAGRIADDGVFYDNTSMSVGDIQNFLNGKVTTCDTQGTQSAADLGYPGMTHAQYAASRGWPGPPYVCLKDYYQVPRSDAVVNNFSGSIPAGAISAAQIIKNAADTYGVSPKTLLATLQKESPGPLISDTWPLQSQYRNAMGYGCPDTAPCDPAYEGFYNQITNAARQFKLYKDDSASYRYKPFQNNSIYYSPNASCGAGTVYVENYATAGLYNYTPYQPNQAALNNLYGTGDGCSAYGNRNFWRIYNDWFGPTVGPSYAWQYQDQGAYSNSTRTRPYSYEKVSIAPGEKAYITLHAKNTGNTVWQKGTVKLGTSHSSDRASAFSDNSWLSPTRIELQEATVNPGGTGTFLFSVTAPTKLGSYKEYFNLVAEGITWFNDPGMHVLIDVTPKQTGNPAFMNSLQTGQALNADQSLYSSDGKTILTMQSDGNLVLYRDFRVVWSSGTDVLGGKSLVMKSDGNLVVNNASSTPVWSSGTSGNSGARFVLQSDANMVVYTTGNSPVWSSSTDTNPDGLGRVNDALPFGRLQVNQSLDSADLYYRLILQGDGNLVLYANSRAIWSSNTYGKPSASLDMQGDGNLVLYTKDHRALWSSGTYGKGSIHTVMQGDGNLVTYTANGSPVWSSGTANVR